MPHGVADFNLHLPPYARGGGGGMEICYSSANGGSWFSNVVFMLK